MKGRESNEDDQGLIERRGEGLRGGEVAGGGGGEGEKSSPHTNPEKKGPSIEECSSSFHSKCKYLLLCPSKGYRCLFVVV